MSTIQIKRGTGSAVPSGLADGELAINLDSGRFYYGSGSTSINDFRFRNLTADNYIVSNSVTNITTQQLSGSTQFGDSEDDTHQITGSLRILGPITSSETVSANTGSYHILKGNSAQDTGLEVSGYISSSDITSSGNISSSNNIYAANYYKNETQIDSRVWGSTLLDGTNGTNNELAIFTDSNSVEGDPDITYDGTTFKAISNFSSSGEMTVGTLGARQNHTVYGRLHVIGSDITIGDGHISMSGNLVMTGSISGSATTTASFAHIITQGDTIEFKDGSTKLGAIKFDASDGLKTLDGSGNDGKIKTKYVTAETTLSSAGDLTVTGKTELSGALTASVITSSEMITPTLKGSGSNTTGLIVAGYANVQGAITASGEISSSGTIIASRVKAKGSLIDLFNGHITASGNISSSAQVRALTGSFGTGTTTVTDKIFTTGEISASKVDAPQVISDLLEVKAGGRLKVKGSDITLENGHISMSGNLVATGSISSSATIFGLTGSFGTGTTTITDFIHTTGTITGSYIEAPRVVSDLLEVKAGGRLKVKGSDITLEHGNISMSGDMLMTGSITAGGNVTAGSNGTGSFDHIITLDDTIEFRNKSNKNEVKGFMKFDPDKGLVTLSGSNKVNILSTVKIKPTDFYPTGTATGGKGGITYLQPRNGNSSVRALAAGIFTCEVKIPKGLTPGNVVIFGSDTTNTYKVYVGTLANNNTATNVTPAASSVAVGTLCNPSTTFSKAGITWNSNNHYLLFEVTTNGTDEIYGGSIAVS
tara:strand:+ start:1037 stop:3331 length:2295 start_codon:yes stop_codon:yes gene_type:complete